MDKDQLAVEELNLLQAIIARQDFIVKGGLMLETPSSLTPAIPAARIKVLCNPIISSVQQPAGYLYPAFETLF